MAAFFGVVVFRSVFSRNRWATDVTTAIYFALAVMALFGVVANIAEAIVEDHNLDLTFLVIFAVVGLAVGGYCVFCGMRSLRWGRKLRSYHSKEVSVGSSLPTISQQATEQMLKPHRGATILTLGVIGVTLPAILVCAIIAWVMGNKDLREMNAGTMDPAGRGMTQAGKICGIIGFLVGFPLAVLALFLLAVMAI